MPGVLCCLAESLLESCCGSSRSWCSLSSVVLIFLIVVVVGS